MRNMISCAACKFKLLHPDLPDTELIIADNCHYGRNMQSVTKALRAAGYTVKMMHKEPDCGQGFLDEAGNYLDRSEAYKVAVSSGQPFNPEYTLSGNKLDSSCIRHFPKHESLSKYYKN